MTTFSLKDTLGWGFFLWFVGYVLGFILFFLVPPSMIGWVITPIGVALTLWVLLKKVGKTSLQSPLPLALSWTLLAILFDYLFIVLTLHPVDGYYKPDVFLYYTLTFCLPLIVSWYTKNRHG